MPQSNAFKFANNILTNGGYDAADLVGAADDYVLLATTNITSSTASVSFDGYFSATYKNYIIIGSSIGAATNGTGVNIRFRRSNADVTTSNYVMASVRAQASSATGSSAGSNNNFATSHIDLVNGLSSTGSLSFRMTIFDPLNASVYKWIEYAAMEDNTNGYIYSTWGHATIKDNTNAYSGITFFMDSGNISYGNFKLYGIK